MSRMNPARHTRPTSRERRTSAIARSYASRLTYSRAPTTSVLDSRVARTPQSSSRRLIGQNRSQSGVELASSDRVDDRLEIRTTAGNENSESPIHRA